MEVTLETARLLRDRLATLPEVRDVEVYAGTRGGRAGTLRGEALQPDLAA